MEKRTENAAPMLSYARNRNPSLGAEVYRDGILLVTGGNATLPPICVICGAPGADMDRREFGGWNQITWTRPVTLNFFYCAGHSPRRSQTQRVMRGIALGLCVLVVMGMGLTYVSDTPRFSGTIHAVMFFGAIGAVLMGLALMVTSPKGPVFQKRKGEIYYFSDVHSAVLDALPALGEVPVTVEKVAFDSPRGVEALAVRMEVFVREQKVPEEVERDECDQAASHFVAIEWGKVVGTARVVKKGNVAKIGRVAVLMGKRMSGVGRKLMLAAMEEARAMGVDEMMLTAQVPVIGFYERMGFTAEGEVFEEAGIPHRTMRMKCGG